MVDKDQPDATTDPDIPIDFTTFVLSLSSSAAFHLGLTPRPDQEDCCTNLTMAKQSIDILSLLEEKTQGNLTQEESKILTDVLFNLRMRYVSAMEESGCQDK